MLNIIDLYNFNDFINMIDKNYLIGDFYHTFMNS